MLRGFIRRATSTSAHIQPLENPGGVLGFMVSYIFTTLTSC